MILPAFRLHRPATIDEALSIARDHPGDFDYIAGGTDLLPNYKNRLNPRRHVIALWDVPALRAIADHAFGAMARLADIEQRPASRALHPGLVESIEQVATPLVRQQATLGGNVLLETRCYYFNQSADWRASKGYCMKADGDVCLVVPQKEVCYAVQSGDTAGILLALDAVFTLRGFDGEREVRAREFYQPDGIRRSVMRPGDILTQVRLPADAGRTRSGYLKLRLRDSFDFPDAGVAAAVRLDGRTIEDLSIVVTAVSMTPLCFPEVTDPLRGEEMTGELIERVAGAVAARTQPVRNVMFPPQYRKRMVGVFTRRLLTRLAAPPA